jgi:hypothetical protein
VLGEQFFQTVQGHICQRWRDTPTLGSARFRWEQNSIFDVTGLQPFLENLFIREDVPDHPVVTDVVEAAFDVAL